jgi:hypothetical protein
MAPAIRRSAALVAPLLLLACNGASTGRLGPGLTALTAEPPLPATVVVASGQPTVASFVVTAAN